ncbi:MerR family transcriptional regulator [Actinoplanes sp. NPDC020271]|uniref:helix-turn-helix domain-containing protein n=1 Tax=Actinoplanes sp. NPDC020271 TaxID=3363896 RepID=UPI00379A3F41
MWTMEELIDRVRQALAAEYSGAPNGRVRDLPDRRSIRWYSTIGLVDRPLGTRGRTALYGPRHLLQLVAIKRLQAGGRTLAEIQAELSGVSQEGLAGLARVPADLLTVDPDATPPAAAERQPFWKTPPAPPEPTVDWAFPDPASGPARRGRAPDSPPPSLHSRPPDPHLSTVPAPFHPAPDVPPPPSDPGGLPRGGTDALLTGVPLGGGVILLVPGPLTLDVTDRAELAAAARPLLDLLASRGLHR